jgi:hypothetical protein
MLANLKIIYRFHAHPVHQNGVDIFWPKYVWDDIFRVETTLVPYEISQVNFWCEENKFLVGMSEDI